MTTPTIMNWEVLTTAVRQEIISTYQHESLLSLFPHVPIPKGITAEKWAQKYILETKRAGVHRRGFNPNRISMDFKGFEITPVTIDQAAVMDEIAQAQFAESGMLDKFIPEMGKNMAYTANCWLMMHKGGNAESAPFTEYHYILADGDGGNGTADQPLWLYDAGSAGAWSTLANAFNDLSKLKGGFISKGGNWNANLTMIPKCFAPGVERVRSEYQNKSIADYLAMQGFRWLYVEDDFMKTTASSFVTNPAITAGDIVTVDATEIIIGDQRPERVVAGPGTFPDRNYYIEAEYWGAPLMVPFRKNEAGTIKTYKSMARISAINAS